MNMLLVLWQPDPLIEALEAVIGDEANLDGRLEAAQPDEEVFSIIFFDLPAFTCQNHAHKKHVDITL